MHARVSHVRLDVRPHARRKVRHVREAHPWVFELDHVARERRRENSETALCEPRVLPLRVHDVERVRASGGVDEELWEARVHRAEGLVGLLAVEQDDGAELV